MTILLQKMHFVTQHMSFRQGSVKVLFESFPVLVFHPHAVAKCQFFSFLGFILDDNDVPRVIWWTASVYSSYPCWL